MCSRIESIFILKILNQDMMYDYVMFQNFSLELIKFLMEIFQPNILTMVHFKSGVSVHDFKSGVGLIIIMLDNTNTDTNMK